MSEVTPKSDTPQLKRATTMAEVGQMMAVSFTEETFLPAVTFQPKPSDILVATYPKCGTTWTQQIVHGLRTRGSMDFEEVSVVVPWLESATMLGIELAGPQVAEPRAFKTHLNWDMVPKGGRYIYVMRDPKDALVSYYHYFNGWLLEKDVVSVDAFAREFFMAPSPYGRYWEHLRSWWSQNGQDQVLFVAYEDMKADLPGTIERIARFMGIPLDDELRDIVLRQSSFEFMQQHQHKFDEHVIRDFIDQALNLPPGGDMTKVRSGRVGDHAQEMSPAVSAALDDIWQQEIASQCGFGSYDQLRADAAFSRTP